MSPMDATGHHSLALDGVASVLRRDSQRAREALVEDAAGAHAAGDGGGTRGE